jgi:hypothetical protein
MMVPPRCSARSVYYAADVGDPDQPPERPLAVRVDLDQRGFAFAELAEHEHVRVAYVLGVMQLPRVVDEQAAAGQDVADRHTAGAECGGGVEQRERAGVGARRAHPSPAVRPSCQQPDASRCDGTPRVGRCRGAPAGRSPQPGQAGEGPAAGG